MTETSDSATNQIWIALSGAVHGPYALEKIQEFLEQGSLKMETHARTNSMNTWQPLGEVLVALDAGGDTPAPEPCVPSDDDTHAADEIVSQVEAEDATRKDAEQDLEATQQLSDAVEVPSEVSLAEVEREFGRVKLKLTMAEPFFGHLLNLPTLFSTQLTATAAVALRDGNIRLIINPEFFLLQLTTREERVAVLKHELLHLVFKHLFRFQSGWDPHLANLAADVSVNQYVAPWVLPDDAITLDNFLPLHLSPEKNLEYYYEALSRAQQEMDDKIAELVSQIDQLQEGQQSGQEGSSDGSEQPSSDGGDGEGQGEVSDPTEQCLEGLEQAKEDWEKVKAIIVAYQEGGQEGSGGGDGVWRDDHSGWSEQTGEVPEHKVDDMMSRAREKTSSKDWGSVPGPIQELVEAILERRKVQVDWRRTLRLFACSSNRTRIKSTVNRYSKRFGAPSPGVKVISYQRIAVIIDTSGSVSDEDLEVFFSEIHGMYRNGAEILVIECDCEVQNHYDYQGKKPEGVGGRGGTAFDPAFAFLWELRKRQIFDGCIYLTDGEACGPEIKPPCKLLWVLTPDGYRENLDFGTIIELDY